MILSFFNSLCYTAGWFWCVFLGIRGHSISALAGTIFLIFLQLYCTKIKDIGLYVQDLLLAIFSVPLGIALETLFIQTTFIHYINHKGIFPPIWIVCLYPLFSLLLNHSLKIIRQSYLTSFLFGFFGAPLSYAAGLYLGAVSFSFPLFQTWIMLGIGWGFFLCLLTKIGKLIDKAATETLSERDSKNHMKFLYDGECPICRREIDFLQKKDLQCKINFIDISSKDFSTFEPHHIDYKTAMSQIHAVDSSGNLLVGIPAFASAYARCNLLTLSTFLRIPFVKSILEPMYQLFAKNRLWITGRNKIDLNQ